MSQPYQQNPIWAWVVLILGGLFMIFSLPGMLLTLFMQMRQLEILSSISIIFFTIGVCMIVVLIWGMKRAWSAIKSYNEYKASYTVIEPKLDPTPQEKKPIWPWVVIGVGALSVLGMGPGVIMLPIMPLFLAGMSTDSGTTPEYVPMLILLIGYGIMIGYTILLVKAIKRLRSK
ncbi:hypothetical protein M3175_20005 [Robertmurraya korlensis]|uniref:hypothetical protein n=1 Tax=Robertmurraya korlensis TaxID=519977 RepID=UPI00204072C4|nr:hypothetical protein [Robertmurraya korlensis]MCM3603027.1 hypothetical protein [Robertmurraya korlensis]